MTIETENLGKSTDAPPVPTRLPDGKFAPGNGGRPRGSKNLIARETLLAVKDLREPAMAALADNVRKGNMQAIEFVLDRILPKGRTVELDGASPDDIVAALTNAEISPDEARQISTTIVRLKELKELDELKSRMIEIETLLKDGSI